MRLWSIHPEYLDTKGLVALWRESLLAQNVLLGNTKGYKKHPQLKRFTNTGNPVCAIASYLRSIYDEAERRGYNFNRSKIVNKKVNHRITVTTGQVEYEFEHLLKKLNKRDPVLYDQLKTVEEIKVNPVFKKSRWQFGKLGKNLAVIIPPGEHLVGQNFHLNRPNEF